MKNIYKFSLIKVDIFNWNGVLFIFVCEYDHMCFEMENIFWKKKIKYLFFHAYLF